MTLGVGDTTAERLQREPGAAQRELRDFDDEFYVQRPAPLSLGQVQALPLPGRLDLGSGDEALELELHPAEGHTSDGTAFFARARGLLVVGDYLSQLEIPWLNPPGTLAEYRATLARLTPLVEAAEVVVPGHGPPQRPRHRAAPDRRGRRLPRRPGARRRAGDAAGGPRHEGPAQDPRGEPHARLGPAALGQRGGRVLRKTLIGLALLLAAAAPASAAPELSVSDRLDDRRYAAIGTRAYSVGTEAGRFPAMGFHTRGEMGGIWTPPLKLLDGLWFAVDGQPVGPATRFSSGYGYVTMDLPAPAGLRLRRTEFAPDDLRALLVGLELRAARRGAHGHGLRGRPLRADERLSVGRVDAHAARLQSARQRRGRPRPAAVPRAGPPARAQRRGPRLGRRGGREPRGRARSRPVPASAARRSRPWSAGRPVRASPSRRRAATTPPTARAPAAGSSTG